MDIAPINFYFYEDEIQAFIRVGLGLLVGAVIIYRLFSRKKSSNKHYEPIEERNW